jgi:hypothetical protein
VSSRRQDTHGAVGVLGMSAEVTVVLPTYNRAHLLARAIATVLNQSYRDCHVLVIDDGSTDGTHELAAREFAHEPRVIYVRKVNGGVASARNLGLRLATGDYIAFLDSDDLWRPWKIEVQVACLAALKDKGVGMIWTDFNMVDGEGKLLAPHAMRGMYSNYAVFARHAVPIFDQSSPLDELAPGLGAQCTAASVWWGDVYSRIALGNMCQTSTVMLTRERAQLAGSYDETMVVGEDSAYHAAICKVGPSALLDAVSADYRVGTADQLTQPTYKLAAAQLWLTSVLPAVRSDDVRMKLPRALLREVVGTAHGWVGEEYFNVGERRLARDHLLRSLAREPSRVRGWLLLAGTFVPPTLWRRASAMRRTLRGQAGETGR